MRRIVERRMSGFLSWAHAEKRAQESLQGEGKVSIELETSLLAADFTMLAGCVEYT